VTAIWRRETTGWRVASPAGFDDEAALHSLIEEAPEILPLAGSPSLAVLGREVYLGGNSADLIAVESTGRIVIVEVKLAKNAEARRAVVAQILSYAAYLQGLALETLERDILGAHLAKADRKSIVAAARQLDQTGQLDAAAFESGLRESLASGGFRLVVVLDSAPAELVRLFGYLESIGQQLTLDLVTVSKYIVGSEEVLVPQRVEPEREPAITDKPVTTKATGRSSEGSADFRAVAANATGDRRHKLDELISWAEDLANNDLCHLTSYRSARGDASLLPRMADEGVGFVTIWSTGGFTPWRSVFERRAPETLKMLDEVTPKPIGQGFNVEPTAEVLRLVQRAYREATQRLEPQGQAVEEAAS
jgi:hypothetical protein